MKFESKLLIDFNTVQRNAILMFKSSKSTFYPDYNLFQTIVGILTFMSRINFKCRWVEHEKRCITSKPDVYTRVVH